MLITQYIFSCQVFMGNLEKQTKGRKVIKMVVAIYMYPLSSFYMIPLYIIQSFSLYSHLSPHPYFSVDPP